jgi:TolB-like protein
MIRRRDRSRPGTGRMASRWFVEADAGRADAGPGSQLSAWLLADRRNADAFDRCQAAALLAGKLVDRPGARWMLEDSAALAGAAVHGGTVASRTAWLARPAVAWSVTLVAVIVAAVSWTNREAPEVALADRPVPGSIDLAGLTAALAGADPVVILPGEVVVDGKSLAILPFVTTDDEATPGSLRSPAARDIASRLYEDVMQQLGQLPGVYVADSRSVAAYAAEDLPREQLAALLGVRGIVEGDVSAGDGRIRVFVRMTDVYNEPGGDGELRTVVRRTDVYDDSLAGESLEASVGDLSDMRASITTNIAVVLSEGNTVSGY